MSATPPNSFREAKNDPANRSFGESLERIIADAEDFMFLQLQMNVRERALYYHLLRKTVVVSVNEVLVSIEELAAALGVSADVRNVLRSMNEKRCITIIDRSRKGHLIRLNTPRQISGIEFEELAVAEHDWETADVYAGRKFVAAILHRENHCCFYCARELTIEHVVLDHALSLADGGNSTYRNVVAACHECNSLKQSSSPEEFFRLLYRRGRISANELEGGLARLQSLRIGQRPSSLLDASGIHCAP